MKIQVTQEDIDSGRRLQCNHCPVAKALQRALKNRRIYTDGNFVWEERDHSFLTDKVVASLPQDVKFKIVDFDRDRKMQPFEFELPYEPLSK